MLAFSREAKLPSEPTSCKRMSEAGSFPGRLMERHGYKHADSLSDRKEEDNYKILPGDIREFNFDKIAKILPPDIILMNWELPSTTKFCTTWV